MIPELESPPSPLDDTDDGYGDEADLSELSAEQVSCDRVAAIVAKLREEQQCKADELSSGPDGPDGFGEVEDPDDDDTPDPDDFYGPGGAGCF